MSRRNRWFDVTPGWEIAVDHCNAAEELEEINKLIGGRGVALVFHNYLERAYA